MSDGVVRRPKGGGIEPAQPPLNPPLSFPSPWITSFTLTLLLSYLDGLRSAISSPSS